MDEIGMDIRVCGKKRCARVRGKVDTGAFATIIPQSVADAVGIRPSGGSVGAHGVGNKAVKLREAEATVCLPGGCACRRQKVYIADDKAMHGEVLVGMDFLNAGNANIDARTGRVRCRRKGSKRRKHA